MRGPLILIYISLLFAACSGRKTVLIDGALQSMQQLDKMDTALIFSSVEYKRGKAPEFYQQWNKTKLVVVKTKSYERKLQVERYQLLNSMLDSATHGVSMLIVCDGLIVPELSQQDLRRIPAASLSNAWIMDAQTAKTIYGSQAKPLTLLINTYQPPINSIH
jgi:hypothetical protein